MKNTIILITSLLVICCSDAFSQTTMKPATGKEIYESNCVRCHGLDGKRGKLGAEDLQMSTMPDADLIAIITNGKKLMPASKKKLTTDEIVLVRNYIKTLRK